MAKLIRDVFGVASGEVYPRTFVSGEDCPPELEAAARAAGALEPSRVATAAAAERKAMRPEENK